MIWKNRLKTSFLGLVRILISQRISKMAWVADLVSMADKISLCLAYGWFLRTDSLLGSFALISFRHFAWNRSTLRKPLLRCRLQIVSKLWEDRMIAKNYCKSRLLFESSAGSLKSFVDPGPVVFSFTDTWIHNMYCISRKSGLTAAVKLCYNEFYGTT